MWVSVNSRKSEVEKQISKEIISLGNNELALNTDESEKLAHDIISCLNITPPKYKEQPIQWIDLRTNFRGDGTSYKLGNIQCNLHNLLDIISDTGLAVGSAVSGQSWLTAIAVARILNNLIKSMKIELTKLEGFIIKTIYEHGLHGHKEIDDNTLFQKTNLQLTKSKETNISKDEFDRNLTVLKRLKIISDTGNGYRLIEHVIYPFE